MITIITNIIIINIIQNNNNLVNSIGRFNGCSRGIVFVLVVIIKTIIMIIITTNNINKNNNNNNLVSRFGGCHRGIIWILFIIIMIIITRVINNIKIKKIVLTSLVTEVDLAHNTERYLKNWW